MSYISICPQCGREFSNNKRMTKRFCSNACKQASYRASLPVETDESNSGISTTEKAHITKLEALRTKTCKECGMYFFVNGFQGKKRFCSDKCRQANFQRWDKLFKGTKEPEKSESVSLTPEEELRAMLALVERNASD